MHSPLILIAVLLAAGALWFAGLRLFLRSDLSRSRKVAWSLFLIMVGLGTGLLLPLGPIRDKFLIVMAILPVLAAADTLLLRSRRGLLFWVRACGFEVCTVFGVAAGTRFLFHLLGYGPLLTSVR